MGALYERFLAEEAERARETPLQRRFREERELASDPGGAGGRPNRVAAARRSAAEFAVRADEEADMGAAATFGGSAAAAVNDVGQALAGGAATIAERIGLDLIRRKLAGAAEGFRQSADYWRPDDNSIGRHPTAAAIGGTVGEAAPQFVMGAGANAAAAPFTRGVTRLVPRLAPQVGPALAPGATPAREAAKAIVRELPGQLATNTAVQGVMDPDNAFDETTAGFSLLGTLNAVRNVLAFRRRANVANGETIVGPVRRVAANEVDPQRLEDATYRPDPLAEHVVPPRENPAPAADLEYPLGTTAQGSGPMFQMQRTAFATGEARRRPGPQSPELQPAAAEVQPPAAPEPVTPRVGDRVSAVVDTGAERAPITGEVVARPDGTAAVKIAGSGTLRSMDSHAWQPVSAGVDLNAPPRIPPSTEIPRATRPASPSRGTDAPSQFVDAETARRLDEPPEGPQLGPEPLSEAAMAETGGLKYRDAKSLYGRLSPRALEEEYRALHDAQAKEAGEAQPPMWTEERRNAWIEEAEDGARVSGELGKPPKKGDVGMRDVYGNERLNTQVHNKASLAAERNVAQRARHIESIEAEMRQRGIDPDAVLADRPAADQGVYSSEDPFSDLAPAKGQNVPDSSPRPIDARGYPAEWDTVPPDPRSARPREYLNYAKFGLDRTTEARLRDHVEAMRETGDANKGYQSFTDQQKAADSFAREIVSDPLHIDKTKLRNLTGAQIVGLRTVAGENTRLIEGIARSIDSGELSKAELDQAYALIDAATESTNHVLSAIVRETAQTGRDLGFLRQQAKLSVDPAVWIVRAKKMLGDAPLTDDMMVQIRKLAREAQEACG